MVACAYKSASRGSPKYPTAARWPPVVARPPTPVLIQRTSADWSGLGRIGRSLLSKSGQLRWIQRCLSFLRSTSWTGGGPRPFRGGKNPLSTHNAGWPHGRALGATGNFEPQRNLVTPKRSQPSRSAVADLQENGGHQVD